MSALDDLKIFHLNRSLFSADVADIEKSHGVDMHSKVSSTEDRDTVFYPQFPAELRQTARSMAAHYEIFYCLENFIRELVVETLETTNGASWWDKVPQEVKENVAKNIQREKDAGITVRSSEPINYTTFGELSKIIDGQWDAFSDTFNSRKGLKRILSQLNLLRGAVAHCSELTEDEVLRLRLSLRDWFRLMA